MTSISKAHAYYSVIGMYRTNNVKLKTMKILWIETFIANIVWFTVKTYVNHEVEAGNEAIIMLLSLLN